jgi:uncharacterized small protein (DUF1192 family)
MMPAMAKTLQDEIKARIAEAQSRHPLGHRLAGPADPGAISLAESVLAILVNLDALTDEVLLLAGEIDRIKASNRRKSKASSS